MDCLPTELVCKVIRLGAPLDYAPWYHRERRAFLRACCLTSKLLRDIAQPRLPEVYEVRGEADLQALKLVEDGRTRACRVHTLGLNPHWTDHSYDTAFAFALSRCINAVQVVVLEHELELSDLNGLSKLRRLVISGRLDASVNVNSLARLDTLSELVSDCECNIPSIRRILNPAVTPFLRALSLYYIPPHTEELGTVVGFSRLEMLFTVSEDLSLVAAVYLSNKWNRSHGTSHGTFGEYLEAILHAIGRAPLEPARIRYFRILPIQLRQAYPDDARLERLVNEVTQQYKRRGGRVVWEQHGDEYYEAAISPAFRRWVREEQGLKMVEEEGGDE
ncbi:hypothetical protein JCM8547_000349 [Rhodosporidiobolus lusitaniae]